MHSARLDVTCHTHKRNNLMESEHVSRLYTSHIRRLMVSCWMNEHENITLLEEARRSLLSQVPPSVAVSCQ